MFLLEKKQLIQNRVRNSDPVSGCCVFYGVSSNVEKYADRFSALRRNKSSCS